MARAAGTAGSTCSPTGAPPTPAGALRDVRANPALADLRIEEYDVLDAPTAVTLPARGVA